MSDFKDARPGAAGLTPSADSVVFNLALVCESMELTRSEVMVLVPQARIEITSRLESIREGLVAGDQAGVIRDSHTVKSVTAALCAESTSMAAERLEMSARSGLNDQCAPLALALEAEVTRLLAELDRL